MQIYVSLATRKINTEAVTHTSDLDLYPAWSDNRLVYAYLEIPCSPFCEPAFKLIVNTNLPINYNIIKYKYLEF